MPEYDFVRVKDRKSGVHYTVPRARLEFDKVDESGPSLTELKQDAVDHNGEPLPPEYPESTSGVTAKKEA